MLIKSVAVVLERVVVGGPLSENNLEDPFREVPFAVEDLTTAQVGVKGIVSRDLEYVLEIVSRKNWIQDNARLGNRLIWSWLA